MCRLTEAEITLLELFRPLATHYLQPDVEEIAVCNPGQVFCRLREPGPNGDVWARRADSRLTAEYLRACIRFHAATYDREYHPLHHPTTHGTVPAGDPATGRKDPESPGHRFAAAAGPSVMYGAEESAGGTALCIRQAPPGAPPGLQAWGLRRNQRHAPAAATARITRRYTDDSDDPVIERLHHAASAGIPILVSGATGTGKTTLFRSLLRLLSPQLRVITVEDTREIAVRNPNRVHFVLPRNIDRQHGLDHERLRNIILHFSPDMIVVGELTPGNASLAHTLLTTGHDHFWTTVHAGSPAEAFDSFARLIRTRDSSVPHDELAARLARRMLCIQTSRDTPDGPNPGARTIRTIHWPETG